MLCANRCAKNEYMIISLQYVRLSWNFKLSDFSLRAFIWAIQIEEYKANYVFSYGESGTPVKLFNIDEKIW